MMGTGAPRIVYNNLLWDDDAVLSASGEQATLPASALLDQLRSNVWRSPSGWTVTSGNFQISFHTITTHIATLTVGTYATAAAVCSAIVTAFTTADSTPTWTCTYSGTTHKFTIGTSSGHSFSLSPTALATDFLRDMGYTANTGTATSQVANDASYQSRQAIVVDLLAAQSFQAALIINHNFSASASVKVQASASAFTSYGQTPTATQAMTVGADLAYYFFSASQSFRYLRVLVDDHGNDAAFCEIGVISIAPYLELSGFLVADVDEQEQLTDLHLAANGANFRTIRPTRQVQTRSMRISDQAEKAALEAFDRAVTVGGDFFLLDYSDAPAEALYVYKEKGLSFQMISIGEDGPIWDMGISFREALG